MKVRLYITLFFILVLLAIAFIFGSQNDQLLILNYLIARTEMTVAAAMSLFTGLGFLLGLLVTILWRIVRKSKKALAKNKSQET
ncbi:lipopolysaccharide assembly protein LapA domain-containing protein [Colwellia psychrerythraea]|uniref:lipopolysaccharide assembly protein LapA domain-containing protein n=1 Tax=Colwellia psychrerythraea TaxID=28229 RepID=UPI000519FB38|nr:lipopolysaccharide assembly protein LapA domain-containing protein [Colwellia psychrerythraea]